MGTGGFRRPVVLSLTKAEREKLEREQREKRPIATEKRPIAVLVFRPNDKTGKVDLDNPSRNMRDKHQSLLAKGAKLRHSEELPDGSLRQFWSLPECKDNAEYTRLLAYLARGGITEVYRQEYSGGHGKVAHLGTGNGPEIPKRVKPREARFNACQKNGTNEAAFLAYVLREIPDVRETILNRQWLQSHNIAFCLVEGAPSISDAVMGIVGTMLDMANQRYFETQTPESLREFFYWEGVQRKLEIYFLKLKNR
jgi:hypothetical protein